MPRLSIRQKMSWGAGGLLAILLLYAFLSVQLLHHRDLAIEKIFRDNGDSLAYMHNLTGSVDRLAALLAPGASNSPPQSAALASCEDEIQHSVDAELQNVTEIGEGQAAEGLKATWHDLQLRLAALPRSASGERRYEQRYIEPDLQRLRSLAWQIAGLNLANSRFQDHGRQLLGMEERLLLALLLVAGLVGSVLLVLLARSLVLPLLELIRGVGSLEEGHFDQTVPVRSDDELGQLGLAFNAMAGRLRSYERGNRAKLLRVQRTTQMAIDSFSDPVLVLNASGIVELCNPAARELFGLRVGISLGESSLSGLQRLLQPVLAEGRPYEPEDYREAIKLKLQGKEKDVLPRLLPVLDEQERVVGATLVLADVTGLRRMDAMKSGLIATVSHELMNPLTTLRMGTHLMLEPSMGPRTPEQEALLRSLRENSDRLHAILEELLDLGRLESGDLLHLETRSAAKVLRDALALSRPNFERSGLRLVERIEEDLPPVDVDARRITHVFSNLFDNAIKYSKSGGKVEVGAAKEGAQVRFWVQDSGPGIPEEYRLRIFERFFRIPGRAVGQGVGLGLAIAKEMAELHGGFLSIEDSPAGARFSLLLPSAHMHA